MRAVVMAALLCAAAAAVETHECAGLGFTLGATPCKACDEIAVASADLADECRACCSAALDWKLPIKYDSAVLEVRARAGPRRRAD